MNTHVNNATSCCGWKTPGPLPAPRGGQPRYKEGCEPTWGKESQEEAGGGEASGVVGV